MLRKKNLLKIGSIFQGKLLIIMFILFCLIGVKKFFDQPRRDTKSSDGHLVRFCVKWVKSKNFSAPTSYIPDIIIKLYKFISLNE